MGGFLGYFMIKPLEHNIKSYIKIFLIGIFVGCDKASGLLSAGYVMGFFINSYIAWVLDDYQHNYRFIKLVKYLRDAQFLFIYVRNDLELLRASGDTRTVYPLIFRRVQVFAVSDVYGFIRSLRRGGVYSIFLE